MSAALGARRPPARATPPPRGRPLRQRGKAGPRSTPAVVVVARVDIASASERAVAASHGRHFQEGRGRPLRERRGLRGGGTRWTPVAAAARVDSYAGGRWEGVGVPHSKTVAVAAAARVDTANASEQSFAASCGLVQERRALRRQRRGLGGGGRIPRLTPVVAAAAPRFDNSGHAAAERPFIATGFRRWRGPPSHLNPARARAGAYTRSLFSST